MPPRKGKDSKKNADTIPLTQKEIDEATLDDLTPGDINGTIDAVKESNDGFTEDQIDKDAADEGMATTLGGRQESAKEVKARAETKLNQILSSPEYDIKPDETEDIAA